MPTSPIDFKIEPFESGKVVYQRIAPPFSINPSAPVDLPNDGATAMLYFQLAVTNSGAPRTLTGIHVSFPGSEEPAKSVDFPVDSQNVIKKTANVEMGGAEAILLRTFPTEVKIELVFADGHRAANTWPLGPHSISYSFPLRREAPEFGECAVLPGIHVGGGGVQHFGYDIAVAGRNQDGTLSRVRTDGKTTADYFSFGRPFYAMAAGIVVYATDSSLDNPTPHGRSFERRPGQYLGGETTPSISVANLSPRGQVKSRFVVAHVGGDHMQLLVFEQSRTADELTLLGGADRVAVKEVSVAGVSETMAVTASHAGSAGKLTLWTIPVMGPPAAGPDIILPTLDSLRVYRLTGELALTVARTDSYGKLRMQLWGIAKRALVTTALDTYDGGSIGVYDAVTMAAGTRVIVAAEVKGNLKLIAFDVVPDAHGKPSIVRRGELQQGLVEEIALVTTEDYPDQIVAAVRTGGKIKLIAWDVTKAGEFARRGDVEVEAGTQVNLNFFKTKAVALAFRSAAGNLKIMAWNVVQDEDTKVVGFRELHRYEAAAIGALATGQVPTDQPTLITASQLAAGQLKVSLWQFSYNNSISVLYGNELISYVHLRHKSIPDSLVSDGPVIVTRGTLLGEMGHSGKSAGPHMHMHAVRVAPALLADFAKLRDTIRAGDPTGSFRPLHFDKAAAAAAATFGVSPLLGKSTLEAEGTYFQTYYVWPGEDPPAK